METTIVNHEECLVEREGSVEFIVQWSVYESVYKLLTGHQSFLGQNGLKRPGL